MRHVRMLGLCLVAALALGAYAVSSASALEWGKCELVGSGGNYTGPNCNKAAGEKAKPKGSGSYEWRKASEVSEKRVAEGKSAGVPFTGESVGSGGVLTMEFRDCKSNETGEGIRTTRQACAENENYSEGFEGESEEITVECETEVNSGEASGKNKVEHVSVVFKGCKAFGAGPCTSPGAEEGEIQVNALKGKLGWINKAEKKVGVLLEPEHKHGTFAEFVCLNILTTVVGVGNKKEGTEYVKGTLFPTGCSKECPGATPEEEKHGGYDGVISPITPVNQMTSEFTQVFSVNLASDQNIPSSFEGKHIDLLEGYVENKLQKAGFDWSASAEEITNVNYPEEEGEIKA